MALDCVYEIGVMDVPVDEYADARKMYTQDELETLAALRQVTQYGRVEEDALTLAVSWKMVVDRFDSERSLSTSDRSVRTEFDYIGALHLRSRVESAIQVLPPALAGKVKRHVDQGDDHLKSFTVERADRLDRLARMTSDDHSQSGWWWTREPKDGPVAEFLDHS